jgi:hypothetical protein
MTAAIASWSVATTTRAAPGTSMALRYTHSMSGRPETRVSGLPGNREDPKRAGMTMAKPEATKTTPIQGFDVRFVG